MERMDTIAEATEKLVEASRLYVKAQENRANLTGSKRQAAYNQLVKSKERAMMAALKNLVNVQRAQIRAGESS